MSRRDVTAFRLASHGLTDRIGAGALGDAASSCGIQDSPPGSALLALHARVEDVTAAAVDDALVVRKSLLRTWSMRGAPYVVPTADAAVFTTGVLPPNEKALRRFLAGVAPAVDELGMTITEAAALTREHVGAVLTGRRLAIGELGAEIAERIAATLPAGQRATWEREGPYAAGQPLGEGVVHFCLRILTLEQVVCFAERDGGTAPFALTEEWLGHAPAELDPAEARAELLRRYLHCCGPSTRAGFAAWIGIRAGDVEPWWSAVADEMTEVEYDGAAWILADDAEELRSPPAPRGVRLLPPATPTPSSTTGRRSCPSGVVATYGRRSESRGPSSPTVRSRESGVPARRGDRSPSR
ncbi:hypothetical protein Rrhod_1652 [Rhodococcus rhodnii LMG 5362]|uniref:Winged helix DNA-binding domain-containing protein n=1 Tax=Rhodococcus rhodnii LMG 5362 TaxID=1273125 RepID=R7WNZ3_9NOCA|nr:hypothetical protein Rrhod_1652 [Rhodococcus rhodnii LMG 5362]